MQKNNKVMIHDTFLEKEVKRYLIFKNLFIHRAFLVLVAIFWINITLSVKAQQGIFRGSPAGSYQISNLDNIDFYSGNLNFTLPLAQTEARGNIGFTPIIKVERDWFVGWASDEYPISTYEQNDMFEKPPLYNPGQMTLHQEGYRPYLPCPGASDPVYADSLNYLIFVSTDGTRYELLDTQTNGTPHQWSYGCGQLPPPWSRGREFTTRDGTSATFVSDNDIYESLPYASHLAKTYDINGWLFFSSGSKYRIENGLVTSQKDRNGNLLSYTYTNVPTPIPNFPGEYGISRELASVTDSINRKILFEYWVNDMLPYGLCDKITFKGFGGQDHIVRISKRTLGEPGVLRQGYIVQPDRVLWDVQGASTMWSSPTGFYLVSDVWLPNAQRYKLQYNSYAELARLELPTGGAYEYEYEQGYEGQPSGWVDSTRRLTVKRTYKENGILESVLTVSRFPFLTVHNPQSTQEVAVDVEVKTGSDNLLSKTKHYYHTNLKWSPSQTIFNNLSLEGKEFKTESFDSNGMILSRSQNYWMTSQPTVRSRHGLATYNGENPRIYKVIKMLLGVSPNLVSMQTFNHDSFNNVTDTFEYDYGSGAPGSFKRRTHTDYLSDPNYTGHSGAHLRGLPTETWTSSDIAGNNKVSRTEFKYDETALMPRSNVVGWSDPNSLYRGNLTKTRSWLKSGSEPETWLESRIEYDVLGNVVKTIDAKGNVSTIDYTDRFGTPDGEARANSAPAQLGGQPTFAFPTSATNALGWITGYTQFDYYTGQPVDAEDINGVVNSTFYNDALDRPTQSIAANNLPAFKRQTNITYDDANRRIETKADLNTFNDNLLKSESYYDGLGRTIETRSYESDGGYVATKSVPFLVMQDPETGNWRAGTKQSNPYRPGAGEQAIWTTALSDALGRNIKTITPDAAMVKTEYSGNAVTVTDQAGKKRRSVTNALGQLTRIDEPNDAGDLGTISSPHQPTNYKYNTLGKMIEVTQGVQKRHFLYDSLGRLLRVRQPEQQVNSALNMSGSETVNNQWTIGLTYDNNGNVLTTTDAKNLTMTNVFDALNRTISTAYSDSVTPTVNFTYDDANVPNSKGKLTKIASTISETKYTLYDKMGRLAASEQTTDGRTYPSGYKYNLSGTLTEQTYPSGRVVKNFLNNDGNLSAISSRVANGQTRNYASNFAYTASGVIKHLQIGNGLWESAKLNSRDQVTELNMGNSPTDASKWQLKYAYGEIDAGGNVDAAKNSGNIAKQTITVAGLAQPFVQTYKYDTLDRITEAKEMNGSNQMWTQNWSYDRYGNRTGFSQNVGGQQMPVNNLTLPTIDANTNRFQSGQGYNYDAAGNVIQDASGRQFIFDGNNKQTEIKDAANNPVGRYYYDGSGKRVKKVTNVETVIFVYDGIGKLAAEYSTAAPVQNPTTNYTATDPLGSPRVITNKQGEIVSRRDFMPFGEEIQADATYRKAALKYGANDNIRQRFTGYQRDEESGLDFAEARYYNNAHGRFTAVDPLLASGKSANPQTFNRYAYTMNRPLILTDPTGLQSGQKVERKLIPLPKVLLDLASMDKRITNESEVYTLGKDEIQQRIELATLAYNEGFQQGERNAQAFLGENVDATLVESTDSRGNEKSNERSTETGISISPKDVGVSKTQTDKVGEKKTDSGNLKVGAKVDSGVAESVAGTKSVAELRQTVINQEGAVERPVIDKNNKPITVVVNTTKTIDDIIKHSRNIGNSDGFISYLKSHNND